MNKFDFLGYSEYRTMLTIGLPWQFFYVSSLKMHSFLTAIHRSALQMEEWPEGKPSFKLEETIWEDSNE